jgi:hypothetical protein
MFCCVLFATLFAQPLALLAAPGVRPPKAQVLSAAADRRTLSRPLMALLAEVAFVTMIAIVLEARLQPGKWLHSKEGLR